MSSSCTIQTGTFQGIVLYKYRLILLRTVPLPPPSAALFYLLAGTPTNKHNEGAVPGPMDKPFHCAKWWGSLPPLIGHQVPNPGEPL